MSVAPGLGKGQDAHRRVGLLLRGDCFFDFLEFKLHELVLVVTIGVVLCQDSETVGFSSFANQPSRRLFGEPEANKLNEAGYGLDQTAQSPGPIRGNVESPKCDPGGDDRTEEPTGVDEGCRLRSVPRVGHLGNKWTSSYVLQCASVSKPGQRWDTRPTWKAPPKPTIKRPPSILFPPIVKV